MQDTEMTREHLMAELALLRRRITALEAAETAHQRAEERFRKLLESAADAMIIVGRSGEILVINHQTEHIFGYRREELIGETIEKLVPVTIDVPSASTGRQSVDVQVPQLVSWRLHERFRWPTDQVLLLSCGVIATPPSDKPATPFGLPNRTHTSSSDSSCSVSRRWSRK